MLAQARDAGLVSMDDPLTKFFPNFKMIDPYDTNRKITLREVYSFIYRFLWSKLASHTAGVPRELPCPWFKLGSCPEEVVLEKLKSEAYIQPQYYRGHYSNLGIALLGRAIGMELHEAQLNLSEKASGVKYEDWIIANITRPLGMSPSTTFDPESVKSQLVCIKAGGTHMVRLPAP